MTKKVKQELIDTFQSLVNSEQLLLQYINHRSDNEIREMLANMQQVAVDIGTKIEEVEGEGEGLAIIHLLEEYCELMWQYNIAEDSAQAIQVYHNIIKIHGLVDDALQNNIITKIEIVFFPYKASMWDSLESIWLAVKDNTQFDVYIVPIPFYRKNKNGSFQEMYYEGEEFPEYVPITDWQQYKIQVRKPDIAFIHNPYDDANNVTSIHPEFYTKKLKEAVSQVVYIPYFVYGDNVYEHFCVLPGTIYADKVIVQSEKVREVYVSCFSEWVHENRLERLFSAEVINSRFLALGSPKIDKLLNSRKEHFILPESWAKKIEGKTVILYNTSVSGLLNENEQQLKKIEDVIACFSDKKEVVLWWRPHPLNQDTCNTMRPQFLDRYSEIVENYKRENVGIFDDTSDLYRALAYTDMYYGDDSSLVHMYGVMGKPIMMQNPYVLLNQKKETVDNTFFFSDCAIEKEKLWFTSGNFNGLYEMNIETGIINCLGKVPGEKDLIDNLYNKIIKVDNELWLIPGKAKEIAKYSLTKGTFDKIKLPFCDDIIRQKFKNIYKWGDKLYMFPWDYKAIVCYDLKERAISYRTDWIEAIEENIGQKIQAPYFCESSCIVGEHLFLLINNTNIIVKYNLNNENIECFLIKEENKYTCIVYDGENFFLVPRNKGNILYWNCDVGILEQYGQYPEGFKHKLLFQTAYCDKEWLWLFPAMGNMILKMNLKTKQISQAYYNNKINEFYCMFYKSQQESSLLFLVSTRRTNNLLVVIDKNRGCLTERVVTSPHGAIKGDLLQQLVQTKYDSAEEYKIYESLDVNINFIIKQIEKEILLLEEKKKFLELYDYNDGTAGKVILKAIMK